MGDSDYVGEQTERREGRVEVFDESKAPELAELYLQVVKRKH
jgi:hypothetical protein